MPKYSYTFDENGIAFCYFLATITAFFVVPHTWKLWKEYRGSDKKDNCSNSPSKRCPCPACASWRVNNALPRGRWNSKVNFVLLAVGWVILAISSGVAVTSKSEHQLYDPFTVLGVSSGASEAVVKKAYRKLSLKFHPDKVKQPSEKAVSEKRFVEISKAYRALTDPVIRKNWEEYGNPDGVKSFKLGIALPLWMISGKSSILLLILYFILFGLGVPYLVSTAWNRSKNYTRDHILHASMQVFYNEVREGMNSRKIIELICLAQEYSNLPKLPKEKELMEDLIQKINEYCQLHSVEHFNRPKKIETDSALKAYVFLFAHLHRIPITKDLTEEAMRQYVRVIGKSIHLVLGILQIVLARKWTAVAKGCMNACQCLISAVHSEYANPLLMLPYIDQSVIRHCKTPKKNIDSIKALLEMTEESRRSLLRQLSDEEYAVCIEAARNIPQIEIKEAKFQVLGHDSITPDDLVSVTVKLSLVDNCKTLSEKEPKDPSEQAPITDNKGNCKDSAKEDEEELEIEGMEIDEDGQVVEVKPRILSTTMARKPDAVHAPFFPLEKSPFWWVMLTNSSGTSFIATPVKVCDLLRHKTVSLQFEAPSRIGTFENNLVVKSDCLIGADAELLCDLVVKSESGKSLSSKWGIPGEDDDSEQD